MSALEISFEFFPPKTAQMEARLWKSVQALAPLHPRFVSVTYGAGGSTRERTHETVKHLYERTHLKPAAHLTCVAASRADVNQVAHDYWEAGIRHIVALRGDPPCGSKIFVPHAQGYVHATDLVMGLKKLHDFEISVAAFPEKHPESTSVEQDIEVLKQKVKAGATRAITQYFFDVDLYQSFLDKVRKAGITIPIVPGLIPISNFAQLKKFSAMCGTTIPDWLSEKFEGLDDNHTERDKRSIELATRQCEELRRIGVTQFHFYTLNRADLTLAICSNLGVKLAA